MTGLWEAGLPLAAALAFVAVFNSRIERDCGFLRWWWRECSRGWSEGWAEYRAMREDDERDLR